MKQRTHRMLAWGILLGLGGYLLWCYLKPTTIVTGFLEVTPETYNLLTGDWEPNGFASYQKHVETIARSIAMPTIFERVADDLADRQEVAHEKLVHLDELKTAYDTGRLSASPCPNTQLIKISLRRCSEVVGKTVVNSVLHNCAAVYSSRHAQHVQEEIHLLRTEKETLKVKLGEQETQQTEPSFSTSKDIELQATRKLYETMVTRLNEMEFASRQRPPISIYALADLEYTRDPVKAVVLAVAMTFFVIGYGVAPRKT